ncbi:MAG: stalk domain-containing protein [Oscillospiraceae bacterium]|nr:stalk domain-containing protein [Oscillospiraceae bacterium]
MKKGKKLLVIVALVTTAVVVVLLTAAMLSSARVLIPPLKVGFLFSVEPVETIAQFLEQPLIYNMEFTRVDAENSPDLSEFDLVIVDASVVRSHYFYETANNLRNYVESGGRIALSGRSRRIIEALKPEAASFEPYTAAQRVFVDESNAQFGRIGQIFADYMHQFVRFRFFEIYNQQQAGYTISLSPLITPIVYNQERTAAVAAMLSLGGGEIYFFGALLPDSLFTTSFDFIPAEGEAPYFINTTAAAEHLLWNELAAVISRDVMGFSMWRIFGPHGRPTIAHQGHSEVLDGFARGHMEIWAELAQRHGQIASFSLAYGLFDWSVRYESFGYSLGNSDGSFQNDRTTDFYSWGTNIVYNGRWLNLAPAEQLLSFSAEPQEATRSFPAVVDFSGDGIKDLISGSSDGYFHVFRSASVQPRWVVNSEGPLTDRNGSPMSVGAFSAPTFHVNEMGGGFMVSGSYDGRLHIWDWYGGLSFGDEPTVISPPPGETLSAPDIVDFNGDGVLDIIVGFASGNIYLLDGASGFTPQRLLETGFENAAPRAIDLTGDGLLDLVVGTHLGDLRKFYNLGGIFEFGGSLQERYGAGAINFRNPDGINSGNNITPLFVDLDGDGVLDLVWGLLEYGRFAVALDDEFFPYREKLLETLRTLEEMFVPVILHSYTHIYKSIEDERASLEAELGAFRAFGINLPTGVNQHTFRTSNLSHGQTLYLQAELGFLWNSGFRPSNSPASPSQNTEYAIITPFYFTGENGHRMLLYNANFLYDRFAASIRYNLPITIYRHTWRQALYDLPSLEDFIFQTRNIQEAALYNFVTELQMFKSIAAAKATDVRVYARPADLALESLRQAVGLPVRLDRFLVIEHTDQSAPLFDEVYADSVGVRIELGHMAHPHLDTDSPVRWANGNAFYLTLSGGGSQGTHIWTRPRGLMPRTHLVAVNLPAEIEGGNGVFTVEFLEDGLQQIFVHSAYAIAFEGEGFELRRVSDRVSRLSKTGPRSTITISALPGTFWVFQEEIMPIRVAIDRQDVIFDDQDPVIIDGRTLIPVRGVFEALGFDVNWDGDEQRVTLLRDDHIVKLHADSGVFTTNGVTYNLDVPAQIIGGRTMLPLRAVLESLGYSLHWDSGAQTVFITT